jgi:hypothetical protein
MAAAQPHPSLFLLTYFPHRCAAPGLVTLVARRIALPGRSGTVQLDYSKSFRGDEHSAIAQRMDCL